MRNHRSPSRSLAAALWLSGAFVTAAAAEPPAAPVLHLTDGGFVAGALADSDRPGVVRWQGAAFTAPFEFDVGAVRSVEYPAPADLPRPEGAYRFELAGGDVLFGSLLGLNDTEAAVDAPPFGPLHVRRADLRRVVRWGGNAGLVYLGPNGTAGWREPPGASAGAWRDESGALATDRDGASVRADLGLPARAVVEFELSWKRKPDFTLALGVGVGPDEASARRAFRFEVWDGTLVALRETDREADLAALGKVSSEGTTGPGAVHFRVYLDQERGTLSVDSEKGERLADLKVTGSPPGIFPGVLLENHRGDVRLDRLRVDRWDGQTPPAAKPGAAGGVRLTDGSTSPGRVTRYDAAAKSFFVRPDDGSETGIPADRVSQFAASPPADDPPRAVRVALQDGVRLSGSLTKVEKGDPWLTVPGVTEPLKLPAAGLRSLVVVNPAGLTTDKPPLTGRLELEGVRLTGRLTDGRERPGASSLTWRPLGSASASPLRPGVSGRIVYKETPPPVQVASPQPVHVINNMGGIQRVRIAQKAQVQVQMRALPGGGFQAQPVGGFQGFVRGFAGTSQAGAPGRKALYLRTGDVIPSEVTKIDEAGVTFRSPLSANTFVPHDKVKAVVLAPAPAGTSRLNPPKRERLLTLPRVQKGSPPTHLIRSLNGDYLRGRVLGLDDKALRVEVRLETKDVPRDRVSRIIWFHADETEPAGETEGEKKKEAGKEAEKDKDRAAPPGPAETTRVQVVRGDGVRLTFAAERVEGATLSGTSDVLGACRVGLDEAEQVLIGGAIARETARLAFQRWKLRNAPEPKESPGEGGAGPGGGGAGTESALVGKPAPDFELGLLGGKTFRLSESKGQVVVLDFWATWCGPCLQAMPQVEKVTREFRDRGVRLVAVNLQEAPEVISAMLQRHKLDLTVALDRSGAVAEKYAANAIPQTVVIDRSGVVSCLFVGGGPHLGDQLRDALNKALPPADGAVKAKD